MKREELVKRDEKHGIKWETYSRYKIKKNIRLINTIV